MDRVARKTGGGTNSKDLLPKNRAKVSMIQAEKGVEACPKEDTPKAGATSVTQRDKWGL